MYLRTCVPEREADVAAWLAAPGAGEMVKDNRVRSVHRWKGLYVKWFKNPGLLGRLFVLHQDRAAREFKVLQALYERGIEAPRPVAWAWNRSGAFVFTEEIAGARPLRAVTLGPAILRDLGRFVRRIHDVGLRHDDLHVGNILLADGRLHVLDVHQARFGGALGDAERAGSLGFMVLSFYHSVSRSDVVRFIRAYGADPRVVLREFQKVRERYFLGRQARVTRDGSDFECVDGMVMRRPYGVEEARRALAAPPLRVVKETPRRRLWLADAGTFVKEGAGALWYNGFGLETRGIPTPRLLACAGRRVVGQWLEGALPLWDHLKAHGVSREFTWRLARLVRRMHRRGVFHRDLKANNILVRGGEITVVDLDRVDFMREVPRDKRIWNLAQLNAAVGAPVTRADRLRFFLAYAALEPEILRDWKGWVREIMKLTVARRHIWPAR